MDNKHDEVEVLDRMWHQLKTFLDLNKKANILYADEIAFIEAIGRKVRVVEGQVLIAAADELMQKEE